MMSICDSRAKVLVLTDGVRDGPMPNGWSPGRSELLFALLQSGWPAEKILRMTVSSITGIPNERAGPVAEWHVLYGWYAALVSPPLTASAIASAAT
jgi:hypothetical protein